MGHRARARSNISRTELPFARGGGGLPRHTKEDSGPVYRVTRDKGWKRREVKEGLPPQPPRKWPLGMTADSRGPSLA